MTSTTRSDTQPGSPKSPSSALGSSPDGLARQNHIRFPVDSDVDVGRNKDATGAIKEEQAFLVPEERDGTPGRRRVLSANIAGGSKQHAQALHSVGSIPSKRNYKRSVGHPAEGIQSARRQEASSAPTGSLRSQGLSLQEGDMDGECMPLTLP